MRMFGAVSFQAGNFRNKLHRSSDLPPLSNTGGSDYSRPDPLNLADISHEGVYGEYFFDTGVEESERTFDVNCSTAVVKDPLSGNPEHWLAVGLHSKYDGDGVKKFGRPNVNLVIVLDISGSMHGTFAASEGHSPKSKMEIAKDSLKTMAGHLKPDDSIGIILFNTDSHDLQTLTKWSDIDRDTFYGKIDTISAGGGTNLSAGYIAASSMLEKEVNEHKNDTAAGERVENRIIFLTDMRPNQGETSEGGLFGIAGRCAEQKIYTTFIGVGLDFNSQMVEHITKNIRGSHYLTVNSNKEFQDLMDENFDFTIFPLVFDVNISLISDGSAITIDKVYGSREANEATGELMKISTIFPSAKKDGFTKGGVVMIKLKTKLRDDQEVKEGEGEEGEGAGESVIGTFQLVVKYDDSIAQKRAEIETYVELRNKKPNHFDNDGVRKGVLLTQYVNLLKAYINKNDISEATGIPSSPHTDKMTGEYAKGLKEGERNIFKLFDEYFRAEKDILKDDELKQELKVLDKIFDLPDPDKPAEAK